MQGSGSKYVKLPDNKPTVIQFADVPPKSSQGKFGPRWDYVVNGSQVFTASDYLADQINATLDALSPGQPRILTITKFKSGNRTRYDRRCLSQTHHRVRGTRRGRSRATSVRSSLITVPLSRGRSSYATRSSVRGSTAMRTCDPSRPRCSLKRTVAA